MKTLREFLQESYQGKIKWISPNPDAEHNEVHYQISHHENNPEDSNMPEWVRKRLTELKDKREWGNAIKSGKVTDYSRSEIRNTNNTGESWKYVPSDAKKRRAPRLYGKNKGIERPIILRNPKTGETHLIAGHHRATYVTDIMKRPVSVHEIT